MQEFVAKAKRIVIGKPFTTDRLRREKLSKKVAFPAFSADTLSSLAYAPDEIILTLGLASLSYLVFSPLVGIMVAALMLLIILAQRNLVNEYPAGGADFQAAQSRLGPKAGQVVGASLLVDYVLTVAVSTTQASAYIAGAIPALSNHKMWVSIAIILALTALYLRGIKQSAKVVSAPVYLFIALIGITLIVGAIKVLTSNFNTGSLELADQVTTGEGSLQALAAGLLIAKAFAGGTVAVTGIKTITNSTAQFKEPRVKNAKLTLLATGLISATFLLGLLWLATKLEIANAGVIGELEQLKFLADSSSHYPVLSQVAAGVFGLNSWWFLLVSIITGLVLCIAAGASFMAFGVLASILAKHTYLPRLFAARGDRLAFSNGIIALAVGAVTLVVLTNAELSTLIQMYVVGVFISFTIGQWAMLSHYSEQYRVAARYLIRRRLRRKKIFTLFSALVITAVLLLVISLKFFSGALVTIALVVFLCFLMQRIEKYYAKVKLELSLEDLNVLQLGQVDSFIPVPFSPSTKRAVVVVTGINRPTLRALTVAYAHSHLSLEALTVKTDQDETKTLTQFWKEKRVPLPLRVIYSPLRDQVEPIVQYVRSLTNLSSGEVVVYIPEYVVGNWWKTGFHNQLLRRLKTKLKAEPKIEVVAVPFGSQ